MAGYRIAVIGAGHIGGTLGKKWAAAGHTVAFGVINPNGQRAQAVRAELGDGVSISSVADALAAAEVVLLAVPGAAMDETIANNAAQLNGKIIIDAANRMGGGGPPNSFATLRARTPNAHIYRAFNIYGWENFAEADPGSPQADLFYCGPDGESRTVVERLIADVGLRPRRVCDVDRVDVVDGVLTLWFALASGQQLGRRLTFRVVTH
jgi:predicted dinucleotide-binding enzyme